MFWVYSLLASGLGLRVLDLEVSLGFTFQGLYQVVDC